MDAVGDRLPFGYFLCEACNTMYHVAYPHVAGHEPLDFNGYKAA